MKNSRRRFFVGDVHGCLTELLDLLEKFDFRQNSDQLFSVGDIIGRGPNPLECLHAFEDRQARIVLGNHELETLQHTGNKSKALSREISTLLNSLGTQKNEWLEKFSTWPLFIELPDIVLVHAGLQPGVSRLEEMRPDILTGIRYWPLGPTGNPKRPQLPWFDCISHSKTVIFGHWARNGLVDRARFKGLDTGCVYGGRLTGFCPEENRFYSVKSRKAYAPIIPME